ncbi:MAG: hypothetical protein V7K27_32815 [Nostoc sp.]
MTAIKAILTCVNGRHCDRYLVPDFPLVVQPLSKLIPGSVGN